MKTKRVKLLVTMAVALAAVTVLTLSRPVEADDRPNPHIHNSFSVAQADGSAIPGGVSFGGPVVLDAIKTALTPSGCVVLGGGLNLTDASGPTFTMTVTFQDTPACVQAMQTFQPDASAFPPPEKSGWTFTRKGATTVVPGIQRR